MSSPAPTPGPIPGPAPAPQVAASDPSRSSRCNSGELFYPGTMDFQSGSVNCNITGSTFEDGVCSAPGLSPRCIKPFKCNYCSCPPQVDPGCPPNNAACAIQCPEEEGGMPTWAIILLIICVIIVLIVGISWASTGNPFAMAELFKLMSL
jgi:hypothetical protein